MHSSLIQDEQTLSDTASLGGCGSGSLSEIKGELNRLNSHAVVFFRDETAPVHAFIQINHITQAATGPQRGSLSQLSLVSILTQLSFQARMMVLSRRVGMLFTVTEHSHVFFVLKSDHDMNVTRSSMPF
jgi:hypothetical protein